MSVPSINAFIDVVKLGYLQDVRDMIDRGTNVKAADEVRGFVANL